MGINGGSVPRRAISGISHDGETTAIGKDKRQCDGGHSGREGCWKNLWNERGSPRFDSGRDGAGVRRNTRWYYLACYRDTNGYHYWDRLGEHVWTGLDPEWLSLKRTAKARRDSVRYWMGTRELKRFTGW